MSLKNQKMIAAKIMSIVPNFIPKIEVDSRTTPRTDDELQFMADLVIALNGKINKIFFDRRVKNYAYSKVHVTYYGDDGFELIINMHRLVYSVDQIVEMVNRDVKHLINHRAGLNNMEAMLAKRDAFDAAVDAISSDDYYKEEIKDMKRIDRNIKVEINGVIKTVNYSTVNGPRVSFIGDSDFDADKNSVFKILKAIGEDDLYFPVDIDSHGEAYFVSSMDEVEEVPVEVKDVQVNTVESKEIAVDVEVKDAVELAIEEFNRNLEYTVNEAVNEIVDHFTNAFIERIKNSEHFLEKVDYQKAAVAVGKQCGEYAPNLYFSTEDIKKMLVEKVKYDHKFSEASKFELFDGNELRQFGSYGVSFIDRDGDSCYGVPERFKPKSGAAVYAETKYEQLFKSAVPDDSDRFEFVGLEPSSHIVELGGKFYVEHRALMCRFMSDNEILAAKPNDDTTDDESYIEMIRESEGDRTDRYVVMIRKIHL